MAYPNSYVPPTTSRIPNDYCTGTGLASSSYGRPDRLASYGTPPSSSNSVPHQYPPQELYVNDSTLSQVASAKNGITLWLSKTEFHPGEIIGGKMRATFAKRTTAKSVCARLSCGAGVEWSTGSGERSVVHKAYTALAPPITVILQENQGQSFFFGTPPAVRVGVSDHPSPRPSFLLLLQAWDPHLVRHHPLRGHSQLARQQAGLPS